MSKIARSRTGDFQIVVPTRRGTDLQNQDETVDGHIRIETYKEIGTNICIDLFVSKVKRADEARITSESFPWNDEGAEEATRFLQENRFKVVIMIK